MEFDYRGASNVPYSTELVRRSDTGFEALSRIEVTAEITNMAHGRD